ncbi:hypothetical protein HDU93_007159 [Gonapodya sp. JEL0774]|nr:hypothetical protein HDU93_007159 [Gonapodya sp. JEL0774]
MAAVLGPQSSQDDTVHREARIQLEQMFPAARRNIIERLLVMTKGDMEQCVDILCDDSNAELALGSQARASTADVDDLIQRALDEDSEDDGYGSLEGDNEGVFAFNERNRSPPPRLGDQRGPADNSHESLKLRVLRAKLQQAPQYHPDLHSALRPAAAVPSALPDNLIRKRGAQSFIVDSDDEDEEPQLKRARRDDVRTPPPRRPASRVVVVEPSSDEDEQIVHRRGTLNLQANVKNEPQVEAKVAHLGYRGDPRSVNPPSRLPIPPPAPLLPTPPAALPLLQPLAAPPRPASPVLDPAALNLAALSLMFPDAHPSYLASVLSKNGDDADAATEEILDKKGKYPKRGDDYVEGGVLKQEEDKKVPEKGYDNVDPTFRPSKAYKRDSLLLLQSEFPHASRDIISSRLATYSGQYGPAFVCLWKLCGAPSDLSQDAGSPSMSHHRQPRVQGRLKAERDWAQRWKLSEPKSAPDSSKSLGHSSSGSQSSVADSAATFECECCCGDASIAKAAWCEGGHGFCEDCVKRAAGERITLEQPRIQCIAMGGDCKEIFPVQELQRVLPEKTWEMYEKLCQRKEIENAFGDEETLEKCPMCIEYGELVAAPPDVIKLFHCKNERCMAVTCRICHKINHLPQTCDEARKDLVLDIQHRVEEVATEALLRTCPQCKNGRKFMKEDGCNKMMCPDCRALICYVCRKLIPEGYKHFNQQPGQRFDPDDKTQAGKCPLWEDTDHRHAKEVSDAVQREREILRAAAATDGVNLDNVKVDVPVVPPKRTHRNAEVAPAPVANAAVAYPYDRNRARENIMARLIQAVPPAAPALPAGLLLNNWPAANALQNFMFGMNPPAQVQFNYGAFGQAPQAGLPYAGLPVQPIPAAQGVPIPPPAPRIAPPPPASPPPAPGRPQRRVRFRQEEEKMAGPGGERVVKRRKR